MKLIDQGFPYPVLTPDDLGNDYADGAFECVLQINEKLNESGELNLQYLNMLSVDEIDELIAGGYATYALDIRCAETYYRRFFNLEQRGTLTVDAYKFHGKVEFTPTIVCTRKISGFMSSDLNHELKRGHLKFEVGNYIAVDRTVTRFFEFNALSLESLVRVRVEATLDASEYSFSATPNYLYINVGTELGSVWKDISGNQIAQPLIAMSIYKDCVAFALSELRTDPDAISYGWARQLEARMIELDIDMPRNADFNAINSIAQKLMVDHGVKQLSKLEF